MILIKGKYRPKNDFYFCYIFHVSKIVSFRLREEKRLLRHFADPRRLGVYVSDRFEMLVTSKSLSSSDIVSIHNFKTAFLQFRMNIFRINNFSQTDNLEPQIIIMLCHNNR